MKPLSVTLLLLWASLAGAADPAPPAAATPAPATTGTPVPPAVPVAPTAPATPATGTAPATTAAGTPPTTPTTPAVAGSADPEAALVKEVTARNTVGRAVELKAGDRTVAGLYTPQTAAHARGAVLLLHDLGGHADWPGVIAPLRRNLPALGWSTLSIQLPVAGKTLTPAQRKAWLDAIAPRIDAGLEFLKGEGQLNVVLAGHGLGAVAALDYVASHDGAVRGLTLIALPLLRGDDPRLATGETLAKVKLPVLDIYGSADVDEVAATALRRKEGAGHGGNYLQVEAMGADHFFTDQDPLLTGRVRGWLDRRVAGIEVRRPAEENAGDTPTTNDKSKGSLP